MKVVSDGQLVELPVCAECGVLLAPGGEDAHAAWHEELAARIAANRPDPRTGFIGG